MSIYIYDYGSGRRNKSPYLISIWGGFCSASLVVAAFAFLNEKLENQVVATVGALAFATALAVSLGALLGKTLAKGRLYVQRLGSLLAGAAFLSVIPIAGGNRLIAHILSPASNSEALAPLAASLLFVPSLLLLSALPPYAAAIIVRRRGSAGSVDRTIIICSSIGYCSGALIAASCLAHRWHPVLLLEVLLVMSLVLAGITGLKNAPRKWA